MSQPTAAARVAGRPHAQASAPQGKTLRVIRGTVERPRGGVFAAICLVVLVSGFLTVLILNTSMAKGAFVLDALQGRSGQLSDTEESLQHAVDVQSAPAQLAQRALKLGMVPSSTAAFLDLSSGRVLGVAKPAQAVPGFTVITSPVPVPVPPKPKPTPAKPVTTVVTKGTVTTTTVVTTKTNGTVVTTVTSVDKASGTTTTRTTTTTKVPPASTPTKPGATTPTTRPTIAPTGTPATPR